MTLELGILTLVIGKTLRKHLIYFELARIKCWVVHGIKYFFWQWEERLDGILGNFPFRVSCMIVSLNK